MTYLCPDRSQYAAMKLVFEKADPDSPAMRLRRLEEQSGQSS